MLSSAVGSPRLAHVHQTLARRPDPPLEASHQTMAKRSRGSTSRPGQRPPLQRQATRPAGKPTTAAAAAPVAAPRPDTLTDAEEARAAELEASIVAEEKAAEAARKKATPRSADAVPARATSSIALSAAEEYAYVARDVRRIAIVGGGLILILLGLWLVVHLTGFSVL
jgi:hypothetical protein